jgi:hypothetical protein
MFLPANCGSGYLDSSASTRDRLTILIAGGYGVFGGRIVELLEDESRLTIIVGGRSAAKAQAHCNGRKTAKATLVSAAFDRNGDLNAQLDTHRPDIVIDASGPFQAYGDDAYRLVEACIRHGVSYLDLADGSDFVAGVGAFEPAAREAGVFVLSGVSSFPVLTAAVVRRLAREMTIVETIGGGIAPSPFAGVGENVIRAIASYAGQPVLLRRAGQQAAGHPFTETMRYTISPGGKVPLRDTLFSLVDVPDLRALAESWPEAKTIWMGAGPVPEILHRALAVLARLVKWKLIRSLSPLAPLMHWVTNNVRWGEHRGGMFVEVTGVDAQGQPAKRSWHLLAEGSDGPLIPAMAVEALVRKTLAGGWLPAGARASLGDLDLADYEALFARRTIYAGVRDDSAHDRPLYESLLGEAWHRLPTPIRQMHSPAGRLAATGRASVERGAGLLSRMAAVLIGFPRGSADVPVKVTFDVKDGIETWTRKFGGQSFHSEQFEGKGRLARLLVERFGPITFAMALVWENERLTLVMRHWRFLGIPMPIWLCPRSDSYETVLDDRFSFHVEISHPLTGLIVRYRGWLEPEQAFSTTGSPASAPSSRQSPAAQSVQPEPVAPEAASASSGTGCAFGS